MSHSVVWVLLAGDTKPSAVEEAVEKALKPFDEEKKVKSYERPCYCVGSEAQHDAEAKASRGGSIDAIRKRFHSDPSTAAIRVKGDEFADLEKLGITQAEWKVANREVNRLWKEAIAPYKRRYEKALNEHPKKDKPKKGCEECKGSGKNRTTYNPKSKWDWYVIGGRWAGQIRGVEVPDDENPFTTGNAASAARVREARNNVKANSRHVAEMPTPIDEDIIPFSILTPDGEWHQRGEMGWFGMVSDDKEDDWPTEARAILAKHVTCLAVAVDVHI